MWFNLCDMGPLMTVVCTKCNWTSFAVSHKQATAEVARFNRYFKTLTKKQQMSHYGGRKASIKSYVCLFCGGKSFKPGNTAPNGSTINSVIYEE